MIEQVRRSMASWICLCMLLATTVACTREEVAEEPVGPDPELVEQVRTDLDTLGEE